MRRFVLIVLVIAATAASPASAKYPVPFKPAPTVPEKAKACGFQVLSTLPQDTMSPKYSPKLTSTSALKLPSVDTNEPIAPTLSGVPKNQTVVIQVSLPCPTKTSKIVIGTSKTSATSTLQLPALKMGKPTSYTIEIIFPDKKVIKMSGIAQ